MREGSFSHVSVNLFTGGIWSLGGYGPGGVWSEGVWSEGVVWSRGMVLGMRKALPTSPNPGPQNQAVRILLGCFLVKHGLAHVDRNGEYVIKRTTLSLKISIFYCYCKSNQICPIELIKEMDLIEPTVLKMGS